MTVDDDVTQDSTPAPSSDVPRAETTGGASKSAAVGGGVSGWAWAGVSALGAALVAILVSGVAMYWFEVPGKYAVALGVAVLLVAFIFILQHNPQLRFYRLAYSALMMVGPATLVPPQIEVVPLGISLKWEDLVPVQVALVALAGWAAYLQHRENHPGRNSSVFPAPEQASHVPKGQANIVIIGLVAIVALVVVSKASEVHREPLATAATATESSNPGTRSDSPATVSSSMSPSVSPGSVSYASRMATLSRQRCPPGKRYDEGCPPGSRRFKDTDLCLDVSEVTAKDFYDYVNAKGSPYKGDAGVHVDPTRRNYYRGNDGARFTQRTLCGVYAPGVDMHLPAVCVSHEEATDYCKKRRMRLPSHAEWARASGIDTPILGQSKQWPFPWGAEPSKRSRYANACDGECQEIEAAAFPLFVREAALDSSEDGFSFLAPVCSLEETGEGFFGLAGNVWEWTCNEEVSGACAHANEGGSRSYRRVGGSWKSSSLGELKVEPLRRYSGTDIPRWLPGEARDNNLGFRCAATRNKP